MNKIIGITIVVVFALWGLIVMHNQTKQKEQLARNDIQANTGYTENNELKNGEYTIDAGTSFITWEGSNIATQHYGTIYVSEGSVSVADFDLSGEVIFDMNTIRSEIGLGLDDHLKSQDFFDVEQYPKSHIDITGYTNGEVQGDLTIQEITQPISLPVTISQKEDQLVMKGIFTIDRTLWGIEYNSGSVFADLGDKAISDIVDLELELNFIENNE